MSRHAEPETGVTLVELVIGLAILGMVAVIGSEIITRFDQSAARAHARYASENSASLLVSTVRKDIMRLPAAQRANLPASCNGLNCVMVLPSGQRVQYQTACVPNPHAARYAVENTPTGHCLPPCPQGALPQVTITRTGGPSQGVTIYGKRTGASDILGAALCIVVRGAGAAQTATLDIAVLAPINDRTARVYRTSETMTFGNAAGLDVRRRR